MICERRAKRFCKDDISLIENYDKAVADTTQTWHCHHRRESVMDRQELIEIGEYYNRPACELIFLTQFEHMSLHRKGKPHSAEHKKNISKAKFGHSVSTETRKKLRECVAGKRWYTDGIKSIQAWECPEGWVPGRITK